MFGKKAQAVLSPAMIMSIVVSLIILAVGVYAFFTTTGMIPAADEATRSAINNTTAIGNQVFNVIGVVLVIGAIMLIVTMVYSYMRPQ
jgi:NADH:ubiquinone oxidoreductase subunit 6 (subunit J)